MTKQEYLLKMELIELVQGYPEIYDIAHLLHKKTYARNAAWRLLLRPCTSKASSVYVIKTQ